jgi:hypothetical protein
MGDAVQENTRATRIHQASPISFSKKRKCYRLSGLEQTLQAANDGRPTVVNAPERVRILLHILRQKVLVDEAELDQRAHRREFVGDARKAVALFCEFRLVLRVPGVDQLTTRLADQYLPGVISMLFHALRRDDAQGTAGFQLNLDAKAEPILLAEVSVDEGFPKLFRRRADKGRVNEF